MSPSQDEVPAELMSGPAGKQLPVLRCMVNSHSSTPQYSRCVDKPMYCAPSTGSVATANPSHGRFAMQISLEHTRRNYFSLFKVLKV